MTSILSVNVLNKIQEYVFRLLILLYTDPKLMIANCNISKCIEKY